MPGAKVVAVARVKPNPRQPRKQFDAEGLDELAASIRERGILQPLVVRPLDDGAYAIIVGERRHRAAILAGLDEIPVLVRETSDAQAYLDALTENLQRANLTDDEEAEAYLGLLGQGYSIRQLAAKLGIAPSKISRVTRIYEDPVLSAAVLEGRITRTEAQEILVAPPEEKPRLVQFIAGRRKQTGPVARGELRRVLNQFRQDVVVQPTIMGPAGLDGSVAIHPEQEDADPGEPLGVAQRNTPPQASGHESAPPARWAAGSGVAVTPDPTLVEARRSARALRLDIARRLAALGSHAQDPDVATELRAIRTDLDRLLSDEEG